MQKESHSSHRVGAVKSSKFSRSDKENINCKRFFSTAEKLLPASDDRLVKLNFDQVFAEVILGRVLSTSEFLSFLLQITPDLPVAFHIFLQAPAPTHPLP